MYQNIRRKPSSDSTSNSAAVPLKETKPILHPVTFRVAGSVYLPAKSYLGNDDGQITRMTSEYKGLFQGTAVKEQKSFSRSFISGFTDSSKEPERMGDALSDFGFAQDVSMEKQSTRLNFRLKNPSASDFMQNISITLKVSDGMPNTDGILGDGVRMITALMDPAITIKNNPGAAAADFDDETGILTIDELGPGDEIAVDFSVTPPEGLNSYFRDA